MRVLIDTHCLIWALDNPSKLSTVASGTLSDPNNQLILSAASIWEMSIKVGIGQLTLSLQFSAWMNQAA